MVIDQQSIFVTIYTIFQRVSYYEAEGEVR